MERESQEGWGVQCRSRQRTYRQPFTHTADTQFFEVTQILEESDAMLHPLIIGIITVNTSLTVVFWAFVLSDAYYNWLSDPEDKPKKLVTPA